MTNWLRCPNIKADTQHESGLSIAWSEYGPSGPAEEEELFTIISDLVGNELFVHKTLLAVGQWQSVHPQH